MSPSEVTVAFLLTNDPSALDQDTRGHGFPLAEHLNEAVVPFKTVSFLGEIVTFGAENVWPGSPFIPVLPRGPASPLKPGVPCGPVSPFIPGVPGGPASPLNPISPLIPGGPMNPRSPGGPGGPCEHAQALKLL